MDLIKGTTTVATKPSPITTGIGGWAARSSSGTGTVITADVINSILSELKNLIEAAGLSLSTTDDTLVKQAVQILGNTTLGLTYDPASVGLVQVTAGVFRANSASVGVLNADRVIVNPSTGAPNILVGKVDNTGTPTIPYIDFRPRNQSAYTDVRISASGGTIGTNFQGTLQIAADSVVKWTDGVINKFDSFPAGTKLVFYQASAPTGWTKVALADNYVLMTGAGGTVGGGGGANHNIVTGCTVVASHNHNINPSTVLSGSENAPHVHTYTDIFYSEQTGHGVVNEPVPSNLGTNGQTDTDNVGYYKSKNTGAASVPHQHYVDIPTTTTNSQSPAADIWQPVYVTVIVAQKDA